MKESQKTVAIIGSGPAGMSAALQLHRFGIKTILFEQSKTGSLLNNAWCVENYLGVSPGKSGPDLLKSFRETLTKNKIEPISERVESLDYDAKTCQFELKASNKNYFSDYVIVASGTKPKKCLLNNFSQSNVLYDVFSLLEMRDKTVIVIGGSDAAFDNALNLAKHHKVMIYNRNSTISALPLLVDQALSHPNIVYHKNHILDVILPGKSKEIECNFAENANIECDYLLFAIGRLPQKDFYSDSLKKSEKQLIKQNKLFLAGDVKNDIYRQVAIASSDGIVAAMRIFHER